MTKLIKERKLVRIHLTNVAGLGAVQLVNSLLPSFEQLPEYKLEEIFLPALGDLSKYKAISQKTKLLYYKRYLPNAISRVLECTIFGYKFNGTTPLLVLGDMPLKVKAKQTVFVQTPLLTKVSSSGIHISAIKYWIAKWIFRRNIKYVSAFIVQTLAMRVALIKTYPEIKDRVHVISQPAPIWLLGSKLKRSHRQFRTDFGLRLFYPASIYPHKNHQLLSGIQDNLSKTWPVSELILTIPESLNPSPEISWIHCVDRLTSDKVLDEYKIADALLFLSVSESFGFPLVEAMYIGLPIICPDLPYARVLCGDQAIYFNPEDVHSLHLAVIDLSKRLASGWWPMWSENLKAIPLDWKEVATAMLSLATGERGVN